MQVNLYNMKHYTGELILSNNLFIYIYPLVFISFVFVYVVTCGYVDTVVLIISVA